LDGEAHIWIVPLSERAMPHSRRQAILSPEERDTAERFVFDADRVRYIAAHTALRALLGARLGQDPRRLRFARTPRGKPYLIGESVRFNLSHSGNYAVIGICDSREIGVDTERIRSDIEFRDIAARYFAPLELSWLMDAPDEEQRERFYRLWVVKEAFLKATGEGLSTPLHEILVEFLRLGPVLRSAPGWSAEESLLVPGHKTAVVVPSGSQVCWHADSRAAEG
jgi:4'-phosphopantetheinyl transferase